jgi:hypothetical protein
MNTGFSPFDTHFPSPVSADAAAAFAFAAAAQAAAYSAAPAGPLDDIRTIFVSGLPQDVKERELNNMLRFVPGVCQPME